MTGTAPQQPGWHAETGASQAQAGQAVQILRPKKEKQPSEHLVLWLTVMAIGFVALRILIVARGDSDTVRALVQNLNVTAIVLATISPFVTTLVWIAFVALLLSAANNTRKQTVGTRGRGAKIAASVVAVGLLFGFPAVAICWYAMPIKYAIFAVVLSVLIVAASAGSFQGQKLGAIFQTTGVLLLLITFVVGLYIVIVQVGVWLPREQLSLGWWKTGTVYVLSSDDVWTKYLDDATHKVRIVPTESVKHRETISSNDHWTNQTLSEIL